MSTLINRLEPYRQRLAAIAKKSNYRDPESSLQLPTDTKLLKEIQQAAKRLRSTTLQYVVVIGIGGSNLGTQAVYEAVAGSMNLLEDRLPKLLFLDTVSDEKMTTVARALKRLASKEDFLAIVISKSGTTTETIANMEVLFAFVNEHFGDASDRFICITDKHSTLWNAVAKKKIETFSIPSAVEGRFSVLSAVGLVPLALAGIDIKELLTGARRCVLDGTSKDTAKNHAITSACIAFHHVQHGRTIHNTFLFSPKLEALGKWYRQLIAESLGKNGKGITPIVSIGSTDLHSQAQLYFDGPDDKFTNLVFSFTGAVHKVPTHLAVPGLVAHIQGASLERIMQAIYGGVKAAYAQTHRPYVEIDLEQASERELGYYLQFRMLETMYLGALMEVNAFNQPAVEMYKQQARELLKDGRYITRNVSTRNAKTGVSCS